MSLRFSMRVCVICLWAAASAPSHAENAAAPWSAKDTRLANEYLSLLVDEPEYGRVVDLLWELYARRDSTALLLENVHEQAAASGHPSVLLVEAHLIRRSGDLQKAATLYDAILAKEPGMAPAARARAEVAIELGDTAGAIKLLRDLASKASDPALWMRLADLELSSGKVNEAAASWEAALKLKGDDLELTRQVAQHLLRAGLPERAEALLSKLAEKAEPAQRVEALVGLARVREYTGRAKEADEALAAALDVLDFRDARYGDVLRRRVRLHERFGTLESFKSSFVAAASVSNATERALYDASRIHALTAEVEEQIKWLQELVKQRPNAPEYRWELVRALLDHEGAAEAAKLLDESLKGTTTDAPSLILLRAEAELRQGQAEEASQRLLKLLSQHPQDEAVEKEALAFSQHRSLDAVTEKILLARCKREPDKPEPLFALAEFYRSRQRLDAAVSLLRTFAESGANATEKARRLSDAASFLANAGSKDEAVKLQSDAAKLAGDEPGVLLKLADMMAAEDDPAQAQTKLEAAVKAAKTLEERVDVDERLHALLTGTKADAPAAPVPSVTSGEFRLPSFITGDGFGSDAPVQNEQSAVPTAVQDYAQKLVEAAREKGASSTQIQRAAWWAQRAGLSAELYELLRQLLLPPPSTIVPVAEARYYLDLALAGEDHFFARRWLLQLLKQDEAGSMHYLLRLAEMSLADKRPDRAISHLTAALKQNPDSEPLLNALSQCYMLNRKLDAALALWPPAIKRASGATAAAMRDRYSELLLKANRLGPYIEVQVEQLETEADVKRRRDTFRRFLDRVTYSDPAGGDLAANMMTERLKQVESRLLERATRHPFDGFYQEALAAIYDRRGDAKKAFQAMKQAYYTSPDTAFSLENLRDAAVRSGDIAAGIYFQKQVAAAASATEQATESRKLVQMMEAAFQMADADKVRRRLENRYSQDPVALEDLARHYAETGQLEAERRVYEQIQKVKAWDARGALRLALTCLSLGDEAAAEHHLRDVLGRSVSKNSLRSLPPERWPFPISDERKVGNSVTLTELAALMDESQLLLKEEKERLRAFLSYPRPEFALLPDDVSLIRLRCIEELAKLMLRQDSAAKDAWIQEWEKQTSTPEIERLWAFYYAKAREPFFDLLRSTVGESEDVDLRFVYAWLSIKSGGISELTAWLKRLTSRAEGTEKALKVIQTALETLAGLPDFKFDPQAIQHLGKAEWFRVPMLTDLARDLKMREQYEESMLLIECLRERSPEQRDLFTYELAGLAESAQDPKRQRQYLMEVIEGPLSDGYINNSAEDPFVQCVVVLHRILPTAQERQNLILKATERLALAPRTLFNRMRLSTLVSLFGADGLAGKKLAEMASGPLLAAIPLKDPSPAVMPESIMRGQDSAYMRGYWEEVRRMGSILGQQGFGQLVADVDRTLENRLGGIPLGPRPGDSFVQWRLARLIRELRESNFPQRQQLIRQYLAAVDMKEEESVETLTELGRELEVHGFVRECLDVYKSLPSRAPTNNTYAEYFIRSCEQGMEPEPGRDYVASLFGKDPLLKPQGISDDTLHEKHARFLALLHDEATLRSLAFRKDGEFSRVKTGRLPPEAAYLRELALLLERRSDLAGALVLWDRLDLVRKNGTPDDPLPQDAECTLHRAQMHDQLGTRAMAHSLASSMEIKSAVEDVNLQLLELRAKLAALLGKWDDVQQLKALAVTSKSLPLTLHLASTLEKHQRKPEALSFLTQAERSSKTADERFRLRLEVLRLLALEPSWRPHTARPQIVALFRASCRERSLLELMVNWLRAQAATSTAPEWVALLKAEVRGSPDLHSAALALAAFTPHLDPGTLPVEFSRAWRSAETDDRICIELMAAEFLHHDRPTFAQAACDALGKISAGSESRRLPVAVLTAGALGDRALQDELYAEVIQYESPGGQRTLLWADAFEKIGRTELAREIYDLSLRRQSHAFTPGADLVRGYARYLIRQKDFEAAERLLMKHYSSFLSEAASPLIDLYTAWGKEKSIQGELAKYYLPTALKIEIQYRLGQKW
jgi:predicted Zn-dependent protease